MERFICILSALAVDAYCLTDSCDTISEVLESTDEVAMLQHSVRDHMQHGSIDKELRKVPASPIAGCEGFDCIKRYVELHDDSYDWRDTGYRISGTGSFYDVALGESTNAPRVAWTGYVLNMTSQTWMNHAVSHPVWWHTLVVILPENRRTGDWATLRLDFGINVPYRFPSDTSYRVDNRGSAGLYPEMVVEINEQNLGQELPSVKAAAQDAAYIAVKTGAIAAALFNLPNGYEVFRDDPTKFARSSDSLRGYTYTDFLLHPDHPEVLHELPVAKAVVRAMDTITAFSAALSLTESRITQFAVTGFSKLGTATLVAGALDDRVRIIVPGCTPFAMFDTTLPIVPIPIPVEEMAVNLSIQPSTNMMDVYIWPKLAASSHYPAAVKMHEIVDPSSWVSRLTKPTLWEGGGSDVLISSAIQAIRTDLDRLPSLSRMSVANNAEHQDVMWERLPSTAAFISGLMQNKIVPGISQTFDKGRMALEVKQVGDLKPISVQQWLNLGELRKCGVAEGKHPTRDGIAVPWIQRYCPVWKGTDLQEALPDSSTWRVDLHESPLRSKVLGMYVTITFEWPDPGSNFTISSDVWQTSDSSMWPSRETSQSHDWWTSTTKLPQSN